MSNPQTEGSYDDNVHYDDSSDHQAAAKGHHRDQTMDQALDRAKTSGETQESLGVKWQKGRYSGKKLSAYFYMNIIITILFVVTGIWLHFGHQWMKNQPLLWWIFFMIIPICFWCHYCVIYIYRTSSFHYRLTTHRLYSEIGFFKKTIDTLEIIDIEDLQMEQTFFDRFVNGGVGTVVILSNDKTTPTLRLEGLENPRDAFESIDEIRRRLRSAGARVIRSVGS